MPKEPNMEDGQDELDVSEMASAIDGVQPTRLAESFLLCCTLHKFASERPVGRASSGAHQSPIQWTILRWSAFGDCGIQVSVCNLDLTELDDLLGGKEAKLQLFSAG